MNLYDKELNNLIASFKDAVGALTMNKRKVDTLGVIEENIELNGILCTVSAVAHGHDQTLSAIIYIKKHGDSDVLRTLAITCAHLMVTNEAIEPIFDIDSFRYGYEITSADGLKVNVSLYNIRNEYSPLDIERLLSEAKSKVAPQAFIGFDMAAPGSDRTEGAA